MKQKQKGLRWDILLIGAAVAAGVILALILLLGGKKGSVVQVRVDGTVVQEFPLKEERTFEIRGADGGTNLLVIKNNTACITEASCPDGLCIHMGRIDTAGQSIVCLPNKVVVEIIAAEGEDAPAVDVTTG